MAGYPYIGGPYDGEIYKDEGTPPTKIPTKREQDTGTYWYDYNGKYHWRESGWKGHNDDLAFGSKAGDCTFEGPPGHEG